MVSEESIGAVPTQVPCSEGKEALQRAHPSVAELLRTSGSIPLPLTAQVPVPLGHPHAPGAPFLLQMVLDVSLQIRETAADSCLQL